VYVVVHRTRSKRASTAQRPDVVRSVAARRKTFRPATRRSARRSVGAVLVPRVNALEWGIARCHAPCQLQPVLEPVRRCPRDDTGRQRSATRTVKAAPAARRGRSITRGAARRRPPTATGRGFAAKARAAPRSSEPDAGRSKLADAKARPSCPRKPEPRERTSGREGRSLRTKRCATRVVRAHERREP